MRNFQIVLSAILLVAFASCNNGSKIHHKNADELSDNTSNQPKQFMLLDGEAHAICYSGFRDGQHPDRGSGAKNPTYDEILEDLKIIRKDAGFKLIRMYDCGENTQLTLQVIDEQKLDIKVLLGIWLRAEFSNHETCDWLLEPIPQAELDNNKIRNISEIRTGISLANKYDHVVAAVNVGNEALVDWNDHKVPVDTVIKYVKQVKAAIQQPVTVADNYKWWSQHGMQLSAVVDFVSIHVYPVWEGKSIDESLAYSIQNVMEVRDSLPDSKIIITEAGWPSAASEFPEVANEINQQRYFDEFMSWSENEGITTFWFEAFDENWKGNPDNLLGAEKHWGLYTVDREPKLVKKSKLK